MKPINTILVPTDFSAPAGGAALYAAQLAIAFQASLVLYHAFVPYKSGFYPAEQSQIENDATANELQNRLNQLKSELQQTAPQVAISVTVDRGPGNKRLHEYCSQHNIDLVVLGTTGASGVKEVLIGSFAADLMTSASFPVLAIPEGCVYEQPKKITFASNFKEKDSNAMQYLHTWRQQFGAQLCVLHINEKENTPAAEDEIFDKYQLMIESRCDNLPHTFQHLAADDVPKAIMEYTATDGTDILAILPIKREGVWDQLLNRSVTKTTAYRIRLPLLTIPGGKQATRQ